MDRYLLIHKASSLVPEEKSNNADLILKPGTKTWLEIIIIPLEPKRNAE